MYCAGGGDQGWGCVPCGAAVWSLVSCEGTITRRMASGDSTCIYPMLSVWIVLWCWVDRAGTVRRVVMCGASCDTCTGWGTDFRRYPRCATLCEVPHPLTTPYVCMYVLVLYMVCMSRYLTLSLHHMYVCMYVLLLYMVCMSRYLTLSLTQPSSNWC